MNWNFSWSSGEDTGAGVDSELQQRGETLCVFRRKDCVRKISAQKKMPRRLS